MAEKINTTGDLNCNQAIVVMPIEIFICPIVTYTHGGYMNIQ